MPIIVGKFAIVYVSLTSFFSTIYLVFDLIIRKKSKGDKEY